MRWHYLYLQNILPIWYKDIMYIITIVKYIFRLHIKHYYTIIRVDNNGKYLKTTRNKLC